MKKSNLPGISGTPFILQFEKDSFKKGDVLSSAKENSIIVHKVYKNTIWRRILVFFGFEVKLLKGQVLVKNI
jgi:hypothetical protein